MESDVSRPSDAEIDLLREVQWSERDPEGRAFAALADAYRKRGELQLARTLAQEGADRLPTFVSGHVVVGLLHRELGSPVEADQAFRRVLEMDPENTVALKCLGELAQERQSHAEAAEYFRKLQVLDPTAMRDAMEGEGADEVPAVADETGHMPVDVATLSPGGDAVEDAASTEPSLLTSEGHWGPGLAPVGIAELSPDTDAGIPDGGRDGVSILDLGPSDSSTGSPSDLEVSRPADAVPVNELAPEEGSFEFSVADLDDVFKVDRAPERKEALGEPQEPKGPIEAEAEDSADPASSAPEWSWSPVSEEELPTGSPAEAGSDASPSAELAPDPAAVPVGELSPEPTPVQGGGIPVGELAPDLEFETSDLEAHGDGPDRDADLEQPIEVHGALDDFPLAEDDSDGPSDSVSAAARQVTDPPGDSDAGESGSDDDFQAWLERNSL